MNFYKCNKKSGPTINVQSSKTVTAGTSQQTVTPDTGYDAMGEVVVNPTPSQSKSVTADTTTITVTPDNGKLLSSVSIAPTPSTAITPSSSGTQFSAGLNNMSSSGWAYSSQPSTGTIKYKSLATPTAGRILSFTLSDADYNLIKSGKALIIAGMVESGGIGSPNFQSYLRLGFSSSNFPYTVITSSAIGNNKTIYYDFFMMSSSYTATGFINLVYIE